MGKHEVDPATGMQIGIKGLLVQVSTASAKSSGRTSCSTAEQVSRRRAGTRADARQAPLAEAARPARLLEARSLTTGYGDVAVVESATCAFARGRITTIIGSNGAGKSTVIKAAAGVLRAWQGASSSTARTSRASRPTSGPRGIGYVPQGRIVFPEMTVQDNLELGAHILAGDRAGSRRHRARASSCSRCSASALRSWPAR